jgi:hypothetical protein
MLVRRYLSVLKRTLPGDLWVMSICVALIGMVALLGLLRDVVFSG